MATTIRGPFQLNGRKSFYVDIGRQRRSLKTDDPAKAEKLVDEIRIRYKEKEKAQTQTLTEDTTQALKTHTFEYFKKQYLEWAEKTQPVKTFKANRLALRKLEPICKGMELDEIGAFHLDQMVASGMASGLKVGAINCYIRHCKSVFGQAVKWGLVKEHPFKDCKQQRANKKPPRALDKADIDALFAVIDDCYDCLVIRAYLITGRSRAELVRLQWKHIDFEGNRYFVTRTKTHLSKFYPMSSSLKVVFESLGVEKSGFVFWKRYHPDTITHKVKKYMVEAGLGHHSLHHLRHSFCRLYLDAGGSIYTLQQLLGHSSVTTTSIYSSLSTGKLAKEGVAGRGQLPALRKRK